MQGNLLQNKCGIISGALDEQSIAWQTALQVHAEGGKIVLTNMPAAIRMGNIHKLAEIVNAVVIPCDMTDVAQVEDLVERSKAHFNGSFDFVLHSVAMATISVRKFHTLLSITIIT